MAGEADGEGGGPAELPESVWHQRWGVWEAEAECDLRHIARLHVAGREVRGRFASRTEALAFQAGELQARLGWPRRPTDGEVLQERSPTWDHPEELEPLKEYAFRLTLPPPAESPPKNCALDAAQLRRFDECGFLLGVPVLEEDELKQVQQEFDELLATRIARAPNDEARFRGAHTISRPLHQNLVARLAKHDRVVAIVEAILGPRCVCWSAHLFCKLPGDPTEQPWHQDAGFWPLSQSRALTLWVAFDDVDAQNSSVTFIEGSHRLSRLPWQPTDSAHHLLTQEIPDVDLLGRAVSTTLRAGEASVHCDLTVHGSRGNTSDRRRAGLALRYVAADADCLGPMINGYRMNAGCILPRGPKSDPRGHWKAVRRRPGGQRRNAPRFRDDKDNGEQPTEALDVVVAPAEAPADEPAAETPAAKGAAAL